MLPLQAFVTIFAYQRIGKSSNTSVETGIKKL